MLWGMRLAQMLVGLVILLTGERTTWRAVVGIMFVCGMQAALVRLGREAERLGLVDRLVDPGTAAAQALSLAQQIAASGL